MAFQPKVDYSGLSTTFASALTVRDSELGGSNEVYQPQGNEGSYVGTEVFGETYSPSNKFGLKAAGLNATAGQIKLGTIVTQDSKKFALASIEISTSGGTPVTISAKTVQVEDGATDAACNHYSVPALSVSADQAAQKLFDAFTLNDTTAANGIHLTACSANISCNVNPDDVAGAKISSDINSGAIVVSGTILQTGNTAPTLAAANGWVVTKPPALSESNPEKAYKTYSFEVQKALTKDARPANQQSS